MAQGRRAAFLPALEGAEVRLRFVQDGSGGVRLLQAREDLSQAYVVVQFVRPFLDEGLAERQRFGPSLGALQPLRKGPAGADVEQGTRVGRL